MRIDFVNDPDQVYLLQSFLKYIEGYDTVSLTGVFDQATFDAVSAFQVKFQSDILTPWGLTQPTGYVYILTLKKINEIYCQTIYPLNDAQQQEIVAYKALIESLRAQGINPELPPGYYGGSTSGGEVGSGTSTGPLAPIVGEATSTPKGQNIRGLAAAIFSMPKGVGNFFQCLWELLLILVVLYILASVLEDVLYSDLPENTKKRFFTKWVAVALGLLVAIAIAWALSEWCLILPFALALLISLITMALYPQRSAIKNWYSVKSAAIPMPPASITKTTTVTTTPDAIKETKTEVKTEPAKVETKIEKTELKK
ncbi:hypothetical protein KW785_00315 [Candidatus Parcubacteria bacterium]|nr:hypothetical protein [Candidatus Parcubacteria bacterium]